MGGGGGGGGAYTWSNTSVKERLGLSAGSLYVDKYGKN